MVDTPTPAEKVATEQRKPRRAVRVGKETSVLFGSTLDDVDSTPTADDSDSNDSRLKRDVPPHW